MTSKFSSAIESSQSTDNPSPRSSPTRKGNLFADYNPQARSPVKENGFALPGSPSLPEIHAFRTHTRTNSDVQGLVKRFEVLDVRDRDAELADRTKRHEAELRRAQIAREEAESDVKRLREETRRLKREGDDGRDRERKVVKRLEVVMVSLRGMWVDLVEVVADDLCRRSLRTSKKRTLRSQRCTRRKSARHARRRLRTRRWC
jgi:seryl-tRNA synthetase